MSVAVPRVVLLVLAAALIAGCSPNVAIPLAAPAAAATVDGQTIPMAAYQARLKVSEARDPFAGIPEAIPSPVPSQRLEDFTIEQLVREAIIEHLAAGRGIVIKDQAVNSRITQLEQSSSRQTFDAALSRNGFTRQSFGDYERALLTEVTLLRAMAKERAASAVRDLAAGESFDAVVAKWNDDTGTASRHGEVGWLRPGDLPEPALRDAVQFLPAGSTSDVVGTNRGFAIARVLERRGEQVHLALILVLAPTVDMLSPQGTPAWFTRFIDDQEAALRRDGKITVTVGSRA
jgi:parvulin-like peptidyl-prolyl isomerase